MTDVAGSRPVAMDGALSGTHIRRRVLEGSLGITPVLDWGTPHKEKSGQFGFSSFDVRLSTHFSVPRDVAFSVIDPTGKIGESGEKDPFEIAVRSGYGRPFVLHPGHFALAYTLEYFTFPKDLMGYVIGRSSWGRLGLIIATATMINPGFRGVITLELSNVGTLPVVLYPCMRIAQLVIHPVAGVPAIKGLPDIRESSEPPAPGADASAGTQAGQASRYDGQLPGNRQRLYSDSDIPWIAPRSAQRLVGVVGPTKAGKSIVAGYLGERGFTQFSLATLVREVARERGMSEQIEVLQDLGDSIRKTRGSDYLARQMSERIRRARHASGNVVITGLKHESEVKYFMNDPRFELMVVKADLDTCWDRRRKEGLPPGATDAGSRAEFEKVWKRDWDSKLTYGQNVRACCELGSAPFENGPGVSLEELKRWAEERVRGEPKRGERDDTGMGSRSSGSGPTKDSP